MFFCSLFFCSLFFCSSVPAPRYTSPLCSPSLLFGGQALEEGQDDFYFNFVEILNLLPFQGRLGGVYLG
jgi:hypothetical protein